MHQEHVWGHKDLLAIHIMVNEIFSLLSLILFPGSNRGHTVESLLMQDHFYVFPIFLYFYF